MLDTDKPEYTDKIDKMQKVSINRLISIANSARRLPKIIPPPPIGGGGKMLLLVITSRIIMSLIIAVDHASGQQAVQSNGAADEQLNQLIAQLGGRAGDSELLMATDDEWLSAAASQQQQQLQLDHHSSPGHYEFDVAPKMEPPTVRKPPYRQVAQTCPGSDLLDGFSPRHTLCGDLNQGRVPLNPLGQSVTDQAYPFEVIKNKTLQFLARALPILKLEYESIPKVARYLNANQLLNPTSHQSPLASAHFHELNRRFSSQLPPQATATNALMGPARSGDDELDGHHMLPPGRVSFEANQQQRRRRKRATTIGGGGGDSGDGDNAGSKPASIVAQQQQQQQQFKMTPTSAADLMMPNATLVVSSAHSAGRIKQSRRSSPLAAHHQTSDHMMQLINSGPLMITRDGPRPLVPINQASGGLGQSRGGGGGSSSSNSVHTATVSASSSATTIEDPPKEQPSFRSASGSSQTGIRQQQQQLQQAKRNAAANAATSTAASNNNNNRSHANQEPAELASVPAVASRQPSNDNDNGQLEARSVATPSAAAAAAGSSQEFAQSRQNSAAATTNNNLQNQKSNLSTSPSSSLGSGSGSGSNVAARRRLNCAELGAGAIASTVCQTAAALIEGDKAPAWVQVAKQIGNFYAAGSSDNLASSSWPLLGGLLSAAYPPPPAAAASEQQTDTKSAGGQAGKPSALASVASIWNLVSPLANFLASGPAAAAPQQASDSLQTNQRQATDSINTNTNNNNQHQQQQQVSNTRASINGMNSLGSLSTSSALTRMALAGWATTALAGLVEYLVPSVFSSLANKSFARRKKPFDPSETFVDTPASLAAISSHAAKLRSLASLPTATGASSANPYDTQASSVAIKQQQQQQQPLTPCPSVEEYISPTFARNYQGAWKYVVQIPHEGYFTQTIQQSSCTRQKCDFTDGVCHEAPRWVSLLVAEIYYPNAIFSAPLSSNANNGNQLQQQHHPAEQQQQQHQMATAQSITQMRQVGLNPTLGQQIQIASANANNQFKPLIMAQDPLQMTDSLNAYNHNLNFAGPSGAGAAASAYLQAAASQLGIDPSNLVQMQQLATDAHNYQLIQRQGVSHSSQAAEARASHQHQQPQLATASTTTTTIMQPQPSYGIMINQQYQSAPSDRRQRLALGEQQQQQQQQQAQPSIDASSSMTYNEYIRLLAAETLRQNPHLTVDDLIKSLQLQTGARRKRDLGAQQQQSSANMVRRSASQAANFAQNEQSQSPNDLSASFSTPINQQQAAYSLSTNSNSGQQQPTTSTRQQQQPQASQQQQLLIAPSPAIDLVQANSINSDQLSSASSGSSATPATLSTSSTSSNTNNNLGSSSSNGNTNSNSNGNSNTQAQTECDGHDKIGCYVVRVYYDWFLVNGSCKCWRTSAQPNGAGQQQQQQSSSSGNSFLRRIFTG